MPTRSAFFCLKNFKRTFKHEDESDEYTVLRLQSLSATRWTTRVIAANVVFEKTVEVRRTLETLVSDPSISADTKARIKGILKHQLSSLHILFNLNVARKLFVLLEKFSKELQAVDMSADYALYSVQHILQRLHEMRDNKEFQRILDEAKSISGIEETSTDGARKRKVPRWMESGDSIVDRNGPHNGDRAHVVAALVICVNHILKQTTSSLKASTGGLCKKILLS